jgi:hypothetical protein
MSTFNITDETKKKKDQMDVSLANMDKAAADYNKMNYGSFVQGDDYKALSQRYQQNGQMAMKDTLGQMAARTGGMASSYANTASQQAYNNYMQQLEDVARAMYNDEYSKARDKVSLAQNEYDRLYGEKRDELSDQRYEDEQAYLRGRDELSDQRYDTEREEARVANDAYYGNDLDYRTYKANGGTLSEQAYNSIVAAAKGKYTDDHYEQDLTAKATRDAELMGLLGAEGFLWGDWNGDGIVGDEEGKTFEDIYGGSSYGEDYWENYYNSINSERTKAGNTAEIKALIANGKSLEDIERDFGISDADGKTWKDLTGMSRAEWENVKNMSEEEGYSYTPISDPSRVAEWRDLILDDKIDDDTAMTYILQLAAVDPDLAAKFAAQRGIEFDIN